MFQSDESIIIIYHIISYRIAQREPDLPPNTLHIITIFVFTLAARLPNYYIYIYYRYITVISVIHMWLCVECGMWHMDDVDGP